MSFRGIKTKKIIAILNKDGKKQGTREPEVCIRLTSKSARTVNEVRYSFQSGIYEVVRDNNFLVDLLTLPSRIMPKEKTHEVPRLIPFLTPKKKEENNAQKSLQHYQRAALLALNSTQRWQHPRLVTTPPESNRGVETPDLEDIYEGVVSKEELARIDSQPNPFNFSERVSQTNRLIIKDLAVQTEPPPSTAFCINVSLSSIYDAYQKHYEKILEREREREREKERERERERERDKDRGSAKGKQTPNIGPEPVPLASKPPQTHGYGRSSLDLPGLSRAAKVLERMVTQNIYDDVCQDFRYWEDGSDEYRPLEGSLLPLWKFNHDKSRSLIVSDVCWSPVYPDLFAAAYTAGDLGGPEGEGMLCLYTLKNPSTPERVFHTPCGVTCVHFHPLHGSMVAAGWSDGTVVVYDASSPFTPAIIPSTTMCGKHLQPVVQVEWVMTEPGEDLCLYSVAMDGRLTQWHLHASTLVHSDVLQFRSADQLEKSTSTCNKIVMEGVGTCIAFRPDNQEVLLIGVNIGAVFQCSITSTTHALTRYPAHTAAVRDVAWNEHHNKVFISCSVDWTVKVWFQYHLSPLIVLDLGGAVAGVTWSPYSSSVFVAVTDEGRVHVYDLSLRKCRPLCIQSIVQRRRIAAVCVSFNPFHPIIVVGGEKGNLLSLKLSPNLRKIHRDAKGAEEPKLKELEVAKMERLIATNRG